MHPLKDPTNAEYNRVHYQARKHKASRCVQCGSEHDLQMALKPDTPANRLRVNRRGGSIYSQSPHDYMTLCRRCHRRLDYPPITHCRNGHPYNAENTYVHPSGSRSCRACRNEGMRRISLRRRRG